MMPKGNIKITRKLFINASRQNIQNYYIFEKVLGKGGYATVWLVTSKDNKKLKRAVKIISKSRIEKSPYLQNEFQILSKLDHPSIIKIYETYEDDRNFYFVLDYCEGGDLFEYLYHHPAMSEHDIRKIFMQMVSVVRYCHNNRIAHRDIKPQNFLLLMKDSFNIKLTDFGMAFQWKQNMAKQLSEVSNKKVGTIYYVSPQILQNQTYDERCDVWSLGVILYAMATASFPFNGANNNEVIKQIKSGLYNKKQLKRVSFFLRDLVDKMLQPLKSRIKIQEIPEHSWIKSMDISNQKLKIEYGRMRNFKKYTKFKKIAVSCIASQLSESEIMKIGEQFKQLDKNYDGYLTLNEFEKCIQMENPQISNQDIKTMVDGIDMDKDGKVNYLQFVSSCLENFVIFKRENIMSAFRILDKNKDGKVSADQLVELLLKESEHNQHIDLEEIQQLIKSCDKNGDGLLDFNEFEQALSQR